MSLLLPQTDGQTQIRPLRAVIEIIGGQLTVYPIAQTDTDERKILDAVRFLAEGTYR